MRELDKSKVYDLSKLTSEECNEILIMLKEIDKYWDGMELEDFIDGLDVYKLKYFVDEKDWNWTRENSTCNAKELFYTLENIQVDCSELSKMQIEYMAKVFVENGFNLLENEKNNALVTSLSWKNLRLNVFGEVCTLYPVLDKTTITHDKFMELFGGAKEQEVILEILSTTDTPDVSYKPKHYSKGIDTFARMEANCTKEECLAFAKGNIDKYNWRNKGQDVEDLKKIKQYADWALKIHAQK